MIKNDHRLYTPSTLYFKYHAPFQDTEHHRERATSLCHQLLYLSNAVSDFLSKKTKKKKQVCVCVSFAGRPGPCHAMSLQSPRLRHYRSKHQIRYMPSKKVFIMCCIHMRKDMRLSRSLVIVHNIIIYIIIYIIVYNSI